MPATIVVVQNWGWASASYYGEVAKNISNMMPIDDGLASKSEYPLRIPNTGTNYSYETWIRCRCDAAPDIVVNNFKVWYGSGMPTPGYTMTVNSTPVNTYTQPVNTVSTRGTRVDFTDYASEENSIALDGDLTEVGDYTSWLVFQVEIINTAQLGEFSVDYLIEYDES